MGREGIFYWPIVITTCLRAPLEWGGGDNCLQYIRTYQRYSYIWSISGTYLRRDARHTIVIFNREMSSLIEILDTPAEHVTGNTVEINGAFPRLESFVSSLV